MRDSDDIPFPYSPKSIQIKQVSRRIDSTKHGIERPIERYGWMSDGPLKAIEKGLPLIFGSPISHSFDDVEKSQKKLLEFEMRFHNEKPEDEDDDVLIFGNEEEDGNFENENNQRFQVANEIKMKELEERILRKNQKIRNREGNSTGITRALENPSCDPSINIIDTIGGIKFHSVKQQIKKPLDIHPFYRSQHEPKKKVQNKSTVPMIQQQLKRVFHHGSPPFENIDKPEDFPTKTTLPKIQVNQNKRAKSDLRSSPNLLNRHMKMTRVYSKNIHSAKQLLPLASLDSKDSSEERKNDEEINELKKFLFDNDNTGNRHNKNDVDWENMPSTLIDSTVDDVFWTKNCTPFTRNDINEIYSWQTRNDGIMNQIDEKRKKMLEKRQRAITTTFQSRKAFDKAIELCDQECDLIGSLGPGKNVGKSRQSFWVRAAEYAKYDNSSLIYRKKKWKEFINQIKRYYPLLARNKTDEMTLSSLARKSDETDLVDESCGLSTIQIAFIKRYKNEIMKGLPIDSTTFWNVIEPFDSMDFTHTEFCILVEILRTQFNLQKCEIIQYLDEKEFPTYFYQLAANSPDYHPPS